MMRVVDRDGRELEPYQPLGSSVPKFTWRGDELFFGCGDRLRRVEPGERPILMLIMGPPRQPRDGSETF